MASAILTVLYPDDLAVYDIRVCEILGFPYGDWSTFSEKLWSAYERSFEAVRENTPSDLSLRDKDRFLWAKSLGEDAEQAARE